MCCPIRAGPKIFSPRARSVQSCPAACDVAEDPTELTLGSRLRSTGERHPAARPIFGPVCFACDSSFFKTCGYWRLQPRTIPVTT